MVAAGDFLAHAQALSAPEVGEADFLFPIEKVEYELVGKLDLVHRDGTMS